MGLMGEQGVQGLKGDRGDVGPPGDTGPPGPTGPAGTSTALRLSTSDVALPANPVVGPLSLGPGNYVLIAKMQGMNKGSGNVTVSCDLLQGDVSIDSIDANIGAGALRTMVLMSTVGLSGPTNFSVSCQTDGGTTAESDFNQLVAITVDSLGP